MSLRFNGFVKQNRAKARYIIQGNTAFPKERIIFTLMDSPEDGIKIIEIKEEREISVDESRNQCSR